MLVKNADGTKRYVRPMKVNDFIKICTETAAEEGLAVTLVEKGHPDSRRKDRDPWESGGLHFKAPNGREAWVLYDKTEGGGNDFGENFCFGLSGDRIPRKLERGEDTTSEGYIRSEIEFLARDAKAYPLTDNERLVRAYADTFFKGSMNALRKFRDSGEQVLSGTTATYAKFYAEHWPIVGRLVHDMVKDIALESDTLADIVMKSVDLAFQEATKPPKEEEEEEKK
jgi:hypothetical protein